MSLVCLVFGVLTACTSEIEENDTEVLIASAKIQLSQEKVTAENSFYEGDLYRFYLNREIEKTNVEIKALEKLLASGKGDAKTKKQLDAAWGKRDFLKNELGSIQDLLLAGIRPLPVPCPPRDQTGKCKYEDSFFVVDERIDFSGGIFYNKKQVGNFLKVKNILGLPKGFKAYKITTDQKVLSEDAVFKTSRVFNGKKTVLTAPLFLN